MRWVLEKLSKRSLSLLLSSSTTICPDPGPYLIVLKISLRNGFAKLLTGQLDFNIVALIGTNDEGAEIISLTSSPLHCHPFFLLTGTLAIFTSLYRTPTCRSLTNDIRSLFCPLRSVPPHERIGIRIEKSFFSGGRPCYRPRFLRLTHRLIFNYTVHLTPAISINISILP